jgi:hypothetical protein
MSYCRWSDDDFRCDLYCYESDGGYVTRIAALMFVYSGQPPRVDSNGHHDADKIALQTKARDKFFENAIKIPIGLPYDGETFVDEDIHSFRKRLVLLKELGYRFPDRVLARIDDEIREEIVKGISSSQVQQSLSKG